MVLGDPWERAVTHRLRATDLDSGRGWRKSDLLVDLLCARRWLFQLGAIHLPVAQRSLWLSHLSPEKETQSFLTKTSGVFPLLSGTENDFTFHLSRRNTTLNKKSEVIKWESMWHLLRASCLQPRCACWPFKSLGLPQPKGEGRGGLGMSVVKISLAKLLSCSLASQPVTSSQLTLDFPFPQEPLIHPG